MQENKVLTLLAPTNSTAAGVTGGYVDLQPYIGPQHREIKFVLMGAPGTTFGTMGGRIQSAEDTAGTGLATVTTFATQGTAGSTEEKHAVVNVNHRYVRFLGSVQATKDMNMAAFAIAKAKVV